MKTTSRAIPVAKAKVAGKPAAKKRRGTGTAAARKRKQQDAMKVAIATELAPAVAIALLDQTEQPPGAPSAALDCLAAGVSASADEGKVRVQLMFENGAVLPVEMSVEAGLALSHGLSDELPGR